ncbi:Protein-export membrane protein SecD [Candidatus Norongarragalina meridionalis]|nr:Protein-export membrane protein SecD [Candidatus Norongarragalina meridionalis]
MAQWLELLKDNKVRLVVACVVLSMFAIFLRDFDPATIDSSFGIEFIGGVRIPISLEKPVDATTMSAMVDVIKTRINKYGLSQAVVRPLGNKEIIVEIPKADASVIGSVEAILKEQGHFEAVVDGRQALAGEDVMQNAVGGPQGEQVYEQTGGSVGWDIVFAVTGAGQMRFADAATGKFGYPVYMFLDRPQDALIVAERSVINGGAPANEGTVRDALRKENDDILLYYAEDFNQSKNEIVAANRSVAIISASLNRDKPEIASSLRDMGFGANGTGKKLVVVSDSEMAPAFFAGTTELGAKETSLREWSAIGLMSAPTLRVEPVREDRITQYSISGTAPGNTTEEGHQNAVNELKMLKSVLSGGRLPVSTSVGSYYDIAPSLGREFLTYSLWATLAAIAAVAALVVLRYRRFDLVFPIVLINSIEILLLFAFIGTFGTIDLSAMAGIISLIGTGVDDQLIITDELARRKPGEASSSEGAHTRDTKDRIAKAFTIIFTVAGVSIASMLPLLLSGIVEITGFALSSIFGMLIGVFITRPAYGVIVERLYGYKPED